MCYNIAITSKKLEIENQLDKKFDNRLNFVPKKHISAFSNSKIPVITSNNVNKIQLYHWGLIPNWAMDFNNADILRKMTYNARSETMKEKPTFKDLIEYNKCIITLNGFYEWKKTPYGKICYYITSSDNTLLSLARIWFSWFDKSSTQFINTVSIITQNANEMMSKIHNVKKRQPVIISKLNYENWINSRLDFQHILDESFNTHLKSEITKSPLKQINN